MKPACSMKRPSSSRRACEREMDLEQVRSYCLSLPHVTESLQWGDNVVFKIGGKMFATMNVDPVGPFLSFKCSLERFNELLERPGIIRAPYLARAQWVALETPEALPDAELRELLVESYRTVLGRLPRKTRAALV